MIFTLMLDWQNFCSIRERGQVAPKSLRTQQNLNVLPNAVNDVARMKDPLH